MRLEKYLADSGIGSRSECKKYIKKGWIRINDEIVKDGAIQVTEKDIVYYMDKELAVHKNLYFMLHKPAGCICATKDAVQETVLDFFEPAIAKHLIIVGRLDKDTEGLLILTDDGDFSHRLTSPSKHVDKTYFFRADGILLPEAESMVKEGLDIGDEKRTLPGKLTGIRIDEQNNCCEAYLTICEGRYHQVKRMVHALGAEVTYLKRISIGKLTLDADLKPGQYRALTEAELTMFGIESRK